MKLKIKLVAILGGCLILLFCFMQFDKNKVEDLIMDNIEALADDGYEYFCAGKGNVACPSGHKVEYAVLNYR